MTPQPIPISFRFYYTQKKDIIEFSIQVGSAPPVAIGMDADSFFGLCEGIIQVGQPFLEEIKRKRAEGIKQDIKAEFNTQEWEKKMEGESED